MKNLSFSEYTNMQACSKADGGISKHARHQSRAIKSSAEQS